MGSGLVHLANRSSPMARLKTHPAQLIQLKNAETRPKTQSAQKRPGEPSPKYSGTSYPGCLLSRRDQVPDYPFTRMPPFPIGNFTKRNSQPAFHDISKCSPKNQSPRLQRNRKALPAAARSGKRLHKKNNKSLFPK